MTLSSGSWDHGRKVFSCMKQPEIFGFYGDVLAVSQALSQLTTLIDLGFILTPEMTAFAKAQAVSEFLFKTLPASGPVNASVLYATRVGSDMASIFSAWEMSYSTGWAVHKLPLPSQSNIIAARGSGADSVKKSLASWSGTKADGTSRAVFSAFCDAVRSGSDEGTGGAPQLSVIYRHQAEILGVIFQGKRYVNGVPVSGDLGMENIKWRNELFEICDWETMEISRGATPNKR